MGGRRTASTRPVAWRAARDLLLRRPPRCGQATGSSPRDRWRVRARCGSPARRPRSTRARSPSRGRRAPGRRIPARGWPFGSSPRASASGSGDEPQGHHPLPRRGARGRERGGRGACRAEGVRGFGRRSSDDRVTHVGDNAEVQAGLATDRFNVAAGTAWLWAAEKSQEMVDVLFVDEAGQMSLANVLAIARSARSIVLLGDPQQLDQPLQGSHPARRRSLRARAPPRRARCHPGDARPLPRADVATSSIGHRVHLDRLLRGQARVPARTWRVSGSSARSRCAAPVSACVEAITLAPTASPPRRRTRSHGSCGRWSRAARRGSTRTASSTRSRYEDVLVVAPYNAQVGAIAALLAARGARRYGRQVPGAGGAGQHLLDDVELARRRAARDVRSSTPGTG